MIRVLFVCLGNICRSPTAEGVFRHQLREAGLEELVDVESAGTHAFHTGEKADSRSVRAAARRGYDLSRHRARPVEARDFVEFDYVLAMDRENLRNLESVAARSRGVARVGMFLEFAADSGFDEVPDPYSRGEEGFEIVLDLIEEAGRGLLEHLRTQDLHARDRGA